MSKVVTDDLLKQVTTDIITSLAEHIVEYEAYSEDEILGLFNLTPEEAQQLSELIRDDIVSQYKLWSSNKVNNEITLTKTECNDYTDRMVAGLSNVKLVFANTLPSIGDTNTIYIHPQLQDDGSVIYTLNIWSTEDSDWVTFGNLNIDFTQYYKKDEVDELLALKADKTEILSQDDVIIDTALATSANVLSAITTLDELDKKIDKDSIVTTLDDTVTDEQILSAKYLYNYIFNKNFNTYTDFNQIGLERISCTILNVIDALPNHSIFQAILDPTGTPNIIAECPYTYGTIIIIKATMDRIKIFFFPNSDLVEGATYFREYHPSTGLSKWKTICGTSVPNVKPTSLVLSIPTTLTVGQHGMNIKYSVTNGVCEMFIYAHLAGNSFTGRSTIVSGVPTPMLGDAEVDIMCTNGSLPYMKVSVSGSELRILVVSTFSANSGYWTGTFRYQVAES